MCVQHLLFIHSSVSGHWVASTFWLLCQDIFENETKPLEGPLGPLNLSAHGWVLNPGRDPGDADAESPWEVTSQHTPLRTESPGSRLSAPGTGSF